MYFLNTQTTIGWILPPNAAVQVIGDFNIVVNSPSDSVFTVPTDFLAPTVDTEGYITYDYTPTEVNLHRIILVKGIIDDYDIIDDKYIYVIDESIQTPFNILGVP